MTVRQQIGSTVDGKYEVLAHLGGGGMGEVYLVRHVHLEEKRVIKILRHDRVGDADAQKRFLREARFATQIKHPNVAILYDYSRLDDGDYYMVWEHIEGEDVGARIGRSGPFPVALAVELAVQGLRGLEAIHAAGMIHRDVSPDNLMLAADSLDRPLLKIIDLGLAKNLEPDPKFEVTQDGMFMGKLLYCAPEQAGVVKGETLDHRTDLYSFSLVLYEMLSGLPAFEAGNPQGAIFKRLSEDPLPLVGRNPEVEIPPALEGVVLRGLARERERRFPSAGAYIEALEAVGQRLRGATTQKLERPPELAALAAGTSPAPSRTELSSEEKEDLLAQIERAAVRVREISQVKDRVQALVGDGRLGEARQAIERLEREDPRSRLLPGLRELVAQAERKGAPKAPPAAPPATPSAPPAAEAPPAPAPAAVTPTLPDAAQSGAAQLERERQIREQRHAERAAELERARQAIDAGRLDEARKALGRAEELSADRSELEPLGNRIAALERAAQRRARVSEAEEMVKKYIKNKQLPLARLALDTLQEIAPSHPSLGELTQWVEMMGEEVAADREAADLLTAGRDAIGDGDFRKARRMVAQLERSEPGLAERLGQELERAERESKNTAELDVHRERFEELLTARELEEAQREIDQMASLGVARVTVDLFRARLHEAKTSARDEAQAEVFVEAFRERIDRGDFRGAREVAGEFQRAVPESSRPSELLAEVSKLESDEARRRSIEQGVSQVESFIEVGDAGRAELALRVLLQMDPGNKKRKSFEKRIAKLR